MKIREDSWHFRLYVFMSQWNAAWRGNNDYLDHPQISSFGIGLCPYMRMILIWGPLAILSNVFPIAAVIGSLVAFPGSVAGTSGIFWLFGWIAGFVGAIFALGWIKNWQDERQESREISQLIKQDPNYVEPESFWKLIKDYVKSAKTKVCPVLELEE